VETVRLPDYPHAVAVTQPRLPEHRVFVAVGSLPARPETASDPETDEPSAQPGYLSIPIRNIGRGPARILEAEVWSTASVISVGERSFAANQYSQDALTKNYHVRYSTGTVLPQGERERVSFAINHVPFVFQRSEWDTAGNLPAGDPFSSEINRTESRYVPEITVGLRYAGLSGRPLANLFLLVVREEGTDDWTVDQIRHDPLPPRWKRWRRLFSKLAPLAGGRGPRWHEPIRIDSTPAPAPGTAARSK
jgi:hypothetical protein